MAVLNGFIGATYTLQSLSADCQNAVNLFPQIDESGSGKNIAALFSTPGLKLFANLNTVQYPGGIRGMLTTAQGRVFAVCGQLLYELYSDGSKARRGELATAAGPVSMAENGKQMMVVDGANGYSLDLATNTMSVMQMTDSSGNNSPFPGGVTVAYQDSYFIFNVPGSQQFYITGQYATTVDPLDFASKEGAPDNVVAVLSDHRELWIFGAETTEVWYNSGAELFPFARIDGAFITHGTIAPASPAALDNTIYWLGQDAAGNGMVWMAQGYQPQRASNHAVEQAIQRYSRIDDAVGFAYQMDGHAFYVLNFPSGNATWVYDTTTQMWHERAYLGDSGQLERHRANCHVMGFAQHLVGDYANGNVYVMSSAAGDDNGREIVRMRTAPYVEDELKNLFFSRLTLDMQTGLGPDRGGRTPVAMLSFSDDGGETWSNERFASLGRIGNRKKRVFWNRLGKSRERVFRVKVTDNVPVALVNAYMEFERGTS